MDASQITKLRQKQNTVYLHRNNTVDSSTQIWRNQIQSSKYVKGVATCTGLINTNVPTQAVCSNGDGTCSYGGRGKQIALTTGSSKHYQSVFSGASGSAAETYSSDKVLLQKAGRVYCNELITDQDTYTVFPKCYTSNTNGPTQDNPNPSVNNNATNPFLPAFDTYYQFKSRITNQPVPDQNLKHFVQVCDDCVQTPPTQPLHDSWPALISPENNDPYSLAIINGVTFGTRTYGPEALHPYGSSTYVTGIFTGNVSFYHGGVYNTSTEPAAVRLWEDTAGTSAFIASYRDDGHVQWVATIRARPGAQPSTLSQGYNTTVDDSGVYVCGYFNGLIEFYHGEPNSGASNVLTQPLGTGVTSMTTTNPSALFIVKYAPDGRLLWVNMVDNVNDIYYTGAIQVSDFITTQICTNGTYVYVCNYFAGGATIYDSNGVNPPTTVKMTLVSDNPSHQQSMLIQYSAKTGSFQWATQTNSSSPLSTSDALAVECDANNVYVSGGFSATMDYYNTRSTPGTFTTLGTLTTQHYPFPTMNRSMYVMSYSTIGAFQWVSQVDSLSPNYGNDGVRISIDSTGLYVLSVFNRGITIYNNPIVLANYGMTTIVMTNPDTQSDPMAAGALSLGVIKYNINQANPANNGKVAWANKIKNVYKIMNGASLYVGASLVSDGVSVYVTGAMDNAVLGLYNSTTTSDQSEPPVASMNPLNTVQSSDPNAPPILDMFLVRYNATSGNPVWMTIAGQNGSTAGSYGVYSNGSKTTVGGFGAGPIKLYNANGLSQPTVVKKTLTPAGTLNFFGMTVNYDINGAVI